MQKSIIAFKSVIEPERRFRGTPKSCWGIFLLILAVSSNGVFADSHGAPSEGWTNVMDYIREVGTRDHTEGIRNAVTAATQRRDDELMGRQYSSSLYFPPGSYSISDTIDVQGILEISGYGASISQTDPEKGIFFSGDSRHINIRGLTFRGGRDQIAIGNHNRSRGFIKVQDCYFWDSNGFAIKALYRFPGDTQSTYFLVEKSWFQNCHQVFHTVSDYSTMRDSWVKAPKRSHLAQEEQNKALFEHRRGNLLLQDIVGIPEVDASDLRWIDNYSSLTVHRFRFGGEKGGYTPVVHKVRGGKVVIEDSAIMTLGNNMRPTAVYCEEMPDKIVVKDSYGYFDEYVMLGSNIDPETYYEGLTSVRVPEVSIPGELSAQLKTLLISAEKRAAEGIDFGDTQISEAETEQFMKLAISEAAKVPSSEPGEMVISGDLAATGHKQQTDSSKYIEITPETHLWDLTDFMNGSEIPNSEYIAIGYTGEDTIMMNRIFAGRFPHVLIRNIEVDLEKTPILSWRMKDNGLEGGSHTAKVVDSSTGEMWTLAKKFMGSSVFNYKAWDLRKIYGRSTGKVEIDVKLYLMGKRRIGIGTQVPMDKGEYFILDFLRLEQAD